MKTQNQDWNIGSRKAIAQLLKTVWGLTQHASLSLNMHKRIWTRAEQIA